MNMKIVYSGIVIVGAVACLLLFMGQAAKFMAKAPNPGTLSNHDIANMSTIDKLRAQYYFKDHSFDFPKIFSSYHPGPYWILNKNKKFKLTDEQASQEQELKMEMARSTIEDGAALRQAYETYATDSAKLDPSFDQIMSDIDAIGKAQTSLASEMVVYHMKGYALLNPDQKKVYQMLVSKGTK